MSFSIDRRVCAEDVIVSVSMSAMREDSNDDDENRITNKVILQMLLKTPSALGRKIVADFQGEVQVFLL